MHTSMSVKDQRKRVTFLYVNALRLYAYNIYAKIFCFIEQMVKA
jgi:hypothetical protein